VQFLQQSPVIKSAFELANCIGYAGKFQEELYAPWRGTKRTELIRYGVESHDAESLAPPDRTARPKRLRVLLIGSFEVRKGQDVALSAFRRLKDENLELHMVGRVLNQKYHAEVMEHFQDVRNAHYLNEVPKDQTKDLMRASDIVIVPSRDEVTPLVILEAMALGKPVVASAICGIPEMITDGQTGLLCEPGNSGQLAKLIARLASDSNLRCELGANARRCQREHWTIERSRQRFRQILGTLA
jgi:glycosyltransferase involved in cell wall biosynthesis